MECFTSGVDLLDEFRNATGIVVFDRMGLIAALIVDDDFNPALRKDVSLRRLSIWSKSNSTMLVKMDRSGLNEMMVPVSSHVPMVSNSETRTPASNRCLYTVPSR